VASVRPSAAEASCLAALGDSRPFAGLAWEPGRTTVGTDTIGCSG
jgi:hypothetical protein